MLVCREFRHFLFISGSFKQDVQLRQLVAYDGVHKDETYYMLEKMSMNQTSRWKMMVFGKLVNFAQARRVSVCLISTTSWSVVEDRLLGRA